MKVKVDAWRILHLFVLVGLTYALGRNLVKAWDMSNLSAYGLSCFATCQASNVLLKLLGKSSLSSSPSLDGDGDVRRQQNPATAAAPAAVETRAKLRQRGKKHK